MQLLHREVQDVHFAFRRSDDIALLSTQLSDAQIMVNMALDFANLEGYELQPKKSVAIHIRGNNKQCETTNEKLNMGNITMPEVEQATHLGIIKTMKNVRALYEFVLLLVEFQLVYKRLGPDSSSVMTGFVE
jgi:hypothetical protein